MDNSAYFDGLIDIPSSNWIYSLEELEKRTPSRLAKDPSRQIQFPAEIIKRCKGVAFIFSSCKYLKLSRSVALTAATLFHRYYMQYDMNSNHYYEIGTASIFIACKAEECRRKLSDIIKVCARIAVGNREPIDEDSKIYWKWKDLIVALEEKMLDTFQFDVCPLNPYILAADVLSVQIDQFKPVDKSMGDEWLKNSTNIFSNAINALEVLVRLPLAILFPIEVVVAVAIVYSSKKTGITVPRSIFADKLQVEAKDVVLCHEIIYKYSLITHNIEPPLQVNMPVMSSGEIRGFIQ